ncbi:tripartite tricarboxylate transporter TctB family protein [Paraburkholderia xenovorans]|uniref:tripartite tricarboxylate transporter TctB family protein n=1 Tax=Paraburkholderia xenovorans TaxID=36873 RepID=UPI0038BD1ABA
MNLQSTPHFAKSKRFRKDLYGGALVFLLGMLAILGGRSYKIGSLSYMGSGFFPVAVGAILVITGLAIAFTGKRSNAKSDVDDALRLDWRGCLYIIFGIAAFVVFGKYGGLLPATFAIVFISALGDRQTNWKSAFFLAVSMCTICTVVFWWALDLQFPLLSWG